MVSDNQRSCYLKQIKNLLLSHDLPVQIGECSEGCTTRLRYPIHVPDIVITGCGIPPEDIGFAVTIEVTNSHDSPVQVGEYGKGGTTRLRYPIHVPDIVF